MGMTQEQAVAILVARLPTVKRTIERLMLWDSQKDLQGNADRLGFSYGCVIQFHRTFGLKFKRNKRGPHGKRD